MADKIITDKGTISLSIVDEIIKSDQLRTSGEDYGYYVNANGETVIGDQSEMNTNMYLDLNKEIKEGGEETTEELSPRGDSVFSFDAGENYENLQYFLDGRYEEEMRYMHKA